ncbi:NADPH-dependent FMN reductase [Inhella gelatinilytica]|uniref:NAD(P)H-dependent oxidoreductase n=1 Tax=Inhella gelatinilytica TaxID=2795030 RepID=A0A931NEB0_9BURK|nr:NAD(P)H-dependent oxidoreductase [Inhella gelatinilytica]MBH9552321.1 NAD(P)H-dependent oxidoreductase [Inhella gelatinilytica]
MKIAVFVGSLRKDSINRRLALALEKLLPSGVTFAYADIGSLPLFNQDEENNPVPSVTALRELVASADGVLFVTPEFNRSIPGVLKNALDHGSRPAGKGVWRNKPAAVLGMSPGAAGTAMAQQHLRNVLAFLNMPTLGQPEMFLQMREGMFDDNGALGEASAAHVQKFVDAYLAWVTQFQPQ